MQRKLLFIWFTHLNSPPSSTPRSFWADTSSLSSIRPKSMVLPAGIFNCSSIFLHIHVTKLKPWVFWDLRDLHHPSRFSSKLCLVRPPCSLACVPYTELHDCTESLLIAEPFPALQDKIDTEMRRGGEMLTLWSQWEPKENVCIPSSSSADCIYDSFFTYFALMGMELLGKHLYGLEISCLQKPGRTVSTSHQDNSIALIRNLE